jgi:hypothetical protein
VCDEDGSELFGSGESSMVNKHGDESSDWIDCGEMVD